MDVHKHGIAMPVASSLLQQQAPDLAAYMKRHEEWMALPAEERRRRHDEDEAKAAELRRQTRARDGITVPPESLVAFVEERQGWPAGYLAHLAQPYCDCGVDMDVWSFCRHARDLWPDQC